MDHRDGGGGAMTMVGCSQFSADVPILSVQAGFSRLSKGHDAQQLTTVQDAGYIA
jgi:hypothetical protein